MLRRSRSLIPIPFDVLLASGLFAAGLGELAMGIGGPPQPIEFVTLPLTTLSLAARRSHPLLVAVAGVTGLLIQTAAGVPQNKGIVPLLGMLVVVYTIGSELHLRRSAAGVVGVAGALVADIAASPKHTPADFLFVLGLVAVSWVAGRLIRVSSQQNRRLAEAREELAQAAVREERSRIARELHDVVAHAMSVMVIHAQAGRQLVSRRPELAADALATIETIGREGLEEMHRLVGLLRADDGGGLAPEGSLDHVDVLVEQVRSAGVPLETDMRGEARELPPGLDLCAYRIVQEALTNVIKHAGSAPTRLTITYRPAALELEVADDGRAPSVNGRRGHGLEGMRERARLYGGTVEAGPRYGGGFTLHAVLPLPAP